jgi:SAM-dependent methyltransferase
MFTVLRVARTDLMFENGRSPLYSFEYPGAVKGGSGMNAPTGGSAYHATDGASYEVFLGRWTLRLAEPLLDFARFPAAGRLLDVGCGTGSLSYAMAARWPGHNVVGIDIAPPYIAFARSKADLANLHFEVADVVRLPYADASFGGAAAQLVLNFVPDPVAALHEIQRVTIRGGSVIAAVWDFRGGLVYQRLFWDTAAGIDPGAAVARDKLFSGPLALPEGLPRLFESVGLAGARVHHHSHGLRQFR